MSHAQICPVYNGRGWLPGEVVTTDINRVVCYGCQ